MIILFEDQALTRFANNTIHQNVSELNVKLQQALATYCARHFGDPAAQIENLVHLAAGWERRFC